LTSGPKVALPYPGLVEIRPCKRRFRGQHRRDFGDKVRGLRLARQWSQEDLAEATGLHRTYVVGVERGARNVSIDAIHKFAVGLGVSIVDLFQPPPGT